MQGPGSGGEPDKRLTACEERLVFSPLRLVCLLAASLLVIELLLDYFLSFLTGLMPQARSLLDSLLTTLFLFPLLLRFVFKPIRHLVADYRASEEKLRDSRDNLEQKVARRTQELKEAISRLDRENAVRREAENALHDSEDRFRQMFEQSEEAVVLIGPDGDSIVDINPAAMRLFGKEREELISGGVRGLFASNQMERLIKAIDEAIAGGTPVSVERIEVCEATGEEILSFRGKQIYLQGEGLLLTTFRNITRRIRLEEESREIQARLIHANRVTSLGMLVASVAHEINNPNNYILLNAELLKRSWSDIHAMLRKRYEEEGEFMIGQSTFSEVAQFLPEACEGIADGARRIGKIVENLKDYARDDHSGLEGRIDLNAVVQMSISILRHLISQTTHRFSLDLGENLPPVRGSGRQLEQVVINLVLNALQSLQDAKHGVRVSTALDGDAEHVLMRIEDEGSGIPDEIAAHIMEPFFTTRLDRGGTGLGLAICANIIRDHDGTIGFETVPGRGTVFTIRLRRAEATDSDQPEVEA